ncbi:MAG: hypothetical protein ABFD10_12520 [Prolixibacteraceae bacterium]
MKSLTKVPGVDMISKGLGVSKPAINDWSFPFFIFLILLKDQNCPTW